jgi:uncharacterized protein (UPF0332 family)
MELKVIGNATLPQYTKGGNSFMSGTIEDYINYRLSKAQESLDDAKLLAHNESWNACINRLYYACYYSVSALMLKCQIHTHTHSGLKSQLGLQFVKTGLLSKENGKLYADLFDWRQKGDYGDLFDHDKDTVEPLIVPVEDFIADIRNLVETR